MLKEDELFNKVTIWKESNISFHSTVAVLEHLSCLHFLLDFLSIIHDQSTNLFLFFEFQGWNLTSLKKRAKSTQRISENLPSRSICMGQRFMITSATLCNFLSRIQRLCKSRHVVLLKMFKIVLRGIYYWIDVCRIVSVIVTVGAGHQLNQGICYGFQNGAYWIKWGWQRCITTELFFFSAYVLFFSLSF